MVTLTRTPSVGKIPSALVSRSASEQSAAGVQRDAGADIVCGGGGMDTNGFWLRLYVDLYRNSKVRILTESLQIRFIWLLCLHKEGKLVGRDITSIAWDLRLSGDDLRQTIKSLQAANLLLQDLTPKGWEDRQYQSDSSTERVRKHRETLQKRSSNATETVQSRDRCIGIVDTDTDNSIADTSAVLSVPLKSGGSHAITQADVERYHELYPYVDIMVELRKLVGWNEANVGKRKTAGGVRRHIAAWLADKQDKSPKPVVWEKVPEDPPGAGPCPPEILARLEAMRG